MRLATEIFQRRLSVRTRCVVFDGKVHDPPETGEMSVRVAPYLSAERSPGAEGYAVDVRRSVSGGVVVDIAGSDRLGLMFGLGALYRKIKLLEDGVDVPVFNEQSAPRYELRSVNQNIVKNMDDRVRAATKARKWTREEAVGYQEELFLMGQNGLVHGWGTSTPLVLERYDGTKRSVNTFASDLAERYGVKYVLTCSINGLGKANMRSDWQAVLFRCASDVLACPSNTDARRALVDSREIAARHVSNLDYVMLMPGDVAGCDCDKCRPWELTYYDLAVEMAAAIHRSHPMARVLVSNQEFQIDQNERFFARYRDRSDQQLSGYVYAPGSNENSFYGYIRPNRISNHFPGCYPSSMFLKSRLRFLAPDDKVAALMDIGHWIRSQTGLTDVDPSWSEMYERRTFNVCPRRIGRIWREVMPYMDLGVGYSETILDDFSKYFSLRLLWNPELSDWEIAREYAALYAGDDVADELTKAFFLHEQNVSRVMAKSKDDIRRCHELVEDVWRRMSPQYRHGNWRILLFRQRVALDVWLSERLEFQKILIDHILAELCKSEVVQPVELLDRWIAELRDSHRPAKLEHFLDIARAADDELDRAAGLRSMELHRLFVRPDQVGAGWLIEQLEKMKGQDAARIKTETLDYDVVGKDEFYDNLGTPGEMPHFDRWSGEMYYGSGRLAKNSRPSQRSYCYSSKALEGVRLVYDGLDRMAEYRVEFGYPNITWLTFAANSPNEFDVFADDLKIGHCVPAGNSSLHFRFRIPRQVTEDGRMSLQFKPTSGKGVSTCISEVWIRKEK